MPKPRAVTADTLITGAGSALAQAFVELLVDRGARLLVTTRSSDRVLPRSTPSTLYLPGIDLTKSSDLRKLAESAEKHFDRAFHVINVAGYYPGQQPFEKTDFDLARRILDANYTSVLGTARYLLPLVKERGGGHFVGFSCHSVQYRYPWMAPYTAAKAALESLIGTLANEFSEFNIVSNAFVLSTLQTDQERNRKPFGDFENWLPPSEVAETVLRFIGDPHGLVNGSTIELFRHSDSFFNESYFHRIRRE